MDIIGYIIFMFLAFVIMPLLVGWIIYIIPKSLGYLKIAKWLTWAYVVLLCLFTLANIFEDELFTKRDARQLIRELDFELSEDFELINNESMSGIGDYYHAFNLSISQKDKQQIVQSIKSGKNFKTIGETIENYHFDCKIDQYKGAKTIQNYEIKNAFVRELFKPNGPNHAPTFYRVTVYKAGTMLTFEDIDD